MKPRTAVLCVATLATTGLLLVACGGGGGRSKPPANRAPVASFTVAPDNGMLPLAVTLDANASRDADGSIASFQWDFGDGATATGAIAQHTYLKSARFEVRLSVTDDDGAVGRAIDAVVVMSPVAASSYRSPRFRNWAVHSSSRGRSTTRARSSATPTSMPTRSSTPFCSAPAGHVTSGRWMAPAAVHGTSTI